MTLIINDNDTNRPMTSDELEQYEQWAEIGRVEEQLFNEAIEQAAAAKASARAKLQALGLTFDEINALIP